MSDETWELVRTDRVPTAGEIRYKRVLMPNPAEPLSQLWPIFYQVIWTGEEWERVDQLPSLEKRK